jgi:hypothetical protein
MRAVLLLATMSLASACSPEHGPILVASPSHASLFGQVDVTLTGDVASLGDIQSVTVGGIAAYDLRATSSSLTVTLQGAPTPGPVAVSVQGSLGSSLHENAFTYDPPVAGVPLLWASFGASYVHGFVSMGLDKYTQTHGLAGDIAGSAGFFLGPSLVIDGLLPELGPNDFNSDCTSKSPTGPVDASKLLNALSAGLTDPATGLWNVRLGRIDPALVGRNFAVGGSTVGDLMTPPSGYKGVLAHLADDPNVTGGDAVSPTDLSQIDQLEKLDPDVAFTADLLGNDLDPAILQSDDVHPELTTPVDQVQSELQQLASRLGALHGQYFLNNLPSLSVSPNVTMLRNKLVAGGKSTADFDAKVKQIDSITDQYNAALVSAVAPYPNLHLVDFKKSVLDMAGGVRAGGESLTLAPFGGLFSLDGLHLTDTAYALYANQFIDDLNAALGTAIAHVDVDAIHATDPDAPSKLRAAGLTCVPPQK